MNKNKKSLVGIYYAAVGCAVAIPLLLFPSLQADEKPCLHCNDQVVLNAPRAQCFLEQYEERMKRLKKSNRGWINVNLEKCQTNKKVITKKGFSVGIDFDPDTSEIIVDIARLECIKNYLETEGQFHNSGNVEISLVDICNTILE